ncbi:LPS export ABC transporter permease LptG [Thiomicrospira sp. WB1]|uniref:LPS export ABC transporter permease LptG n=1 Tax=Thiomicrospira sp. WB1 TaxID=1685380 RepID=UPI0007495981|nr:LPS export ABC transporter permease LptG [Thiomicrospira sp. WB1]KUJ71762.1 LPS export ABC transporter permease LptG [Thiomicrospira sp. WB1]
MNRIERYLGRVLVQHALLVLLVLLSLFVFFEFLNQLGKMEKDYGLAEVVHYSLFKLPVYGYELFPLAVLIGALIGLGGLANQSELIVLRVTGWSLPRIFWALMKSVALLWALFFVLGEGLAPKSEVAAEKVRMEALHENFSIGQGRDLWVRERNRLVHIGKVVSDQVFLNVRVYELNQSRLQSWTQAKRAEYRNGEWVLLKARQNRLSWEADAEVANLLNQAQEALGQPASSSHQWLQRTQQTLAKTPFLFSLTPEQLQRLSVKTRHMGVLDLYDYIGFLEANELDAEHFKLAFWRKIAMPFVQVGMLLMVFPLVFGSQRQVSMGQRVFVGVLIGLSFHLLNQVFGNLSVVYQLPAFLGAFLPSLVLVLLAGWLLARRR